MDEFQFFHRILDVMFLSPQMSAKKGFKVFGHRAVEAMIKEFKQLNDGAFPGKPVIEPIAMEELTAYEIQTAMEAISLIKDKRSGVMKGRTCADDSKQKRYLRPEDSIASPTASTEAIIGTFMIDAYERRNVGVLDILGAYLHALMVHDDRGKVTMVFCGEFVDLLCKVDDKYKKYVRIVNGKKVLYVKVLRAIT